MLPRALAESDVSLLAGIGRGQPNANPYLPPPKRKGGVLQNLGRKPDNEGQKATYIAARTTFLRPPLREGEVEVPETKGGPSTLSGSAKRRLAARVIDLARSVGGKSTRG